MLLDPGARVSETQCEAHNDQNGPRGGWTLIKRDLIETFELA